MALFGRHAAPSRYLEESFRSWKFRGTQVSSESTVNDTFNA